LRCPILPDPPPLDSHGLCVHSLGSRACVCSHGMPHSHLSPLISTALFFTFLFYLHSSSSLSLSLVCDMSLSLSIALYMHMQSQYLIPSLKLKLQSLILIFPPLPIFQILSLLHLALVSGVLHVVIWVPTVFILIKNDPFLPIHVLPTRGHLGRVAPESLCLAARNRG